MTYTPAPWFVDPDTRPGMEWNRHICAGEHDRICFMSNGQNEDNANLIAAAPMLFEGALDTIEALKLLRIGLADDAKVVEVLDAHIDELEYAVAHARGEQQ